MQNIIVLGGLLVLAFPLGAAECQLLLELVDAAGRPIPSEEGSFRIDLVGESDKIVVNDFVHGAIDLECGSYSIRVNGSAGRYAGKVHVWNGRRDARVSVHSMPLHLDALPFVEGRVDGIPDGDRMWVRLLPLVVNVERIRDKYVDGDGVFVFEDLSPGPYLIVYMKEGTPLRVNNVQVYLGDGVTLPPMAWSGSGGSR